ncbi:MAG: carboxypeptidase regulatory-like domain-containing protein [Acidobacteria bacterium]|nr:carboxypeptidase regulatory-like domain-containing protein [Acidobacteriota bacterium]
MKHHVVTAFFAALFLSPTGFGQQTTATLTGFVTDPTGAAVPGVNVKAVNNATNAVREAKTSDNGSYSLPFLPAGE